MLSEEKNNIEREIYIDKISEIYKISKEAIYAEINKRMYSASNASSKILEAKPNIIRPKQEEKTDESVSRREQMLIYILINHTKQALNRLKENVELNCIKSEKNREIIKIIYDKCTEDENIEQILNLFESEEQINYISGILAYDFEITDIEKGIEDIEKNYKRESLVKKRDELTLKLNDTSLSRDEALEVGKKLNDIIVELSKIK